jgi:hypothetical protein
VDENTFARGSVVTVKGIPHRNATTYRANAFASSGSFLDANGRSIFGGGVARAAAPAVAAKGVGAQRLVGLWRPRFQANPPTTPLALTPAGRAAGEGYDQKRSPANTCESMSIPNLYNAPSYVVTIGIGGKQAGLRNQAYKVVRTVPLDGSEAPADPEQQFGLVPGAQRGRCGRRREPRISGLRVGARCGHAERPDVSRGAVHSPRGMGSAAGQHDGLSVRLRRRKRVEVLARLTKR